MNEMPTWKGSIVGRWVTRRNLSLIALSVSIIAMPFSVKICHSGIIVFLLLWAIEGKWKEKASLIKQSTLLQVVLAFSIFQFAGILYAENTSGIATLDKKAFLFLLPLALATTSHKLHAKVVTSLIWLFVASCFAGSVACLITAFQQSYLLPEGVFPTVNFDYLNSSNFKTLNPNASDSWLLFSYAALASGIDIHPAYFSVYIAFCIIFLLAQIEKKEAGLLRIPDTMLAFLVLYFSAFVVLLSTRIVIISLLLIFLFFIFYWLRKNKAKVIALSIFLLTIVTFAFLFVNPVSRYRNWQELISFSFDVNDNSVYAKSTEIRASLWWLAIKSLGQTNLLWGTGSEDVEPLMKRTSAEHNIANVLNTYDPHNQYLYTLLSNGFIGLILLVAVFFIPFYLAWTRRDILSGGFIFFFASLCFTESALEMQKGIIFLSLIYPLLIFQLRAYHTVFTTNKLLTIAES